MRDRDGECGAKSRTCRDAPPAFTDCAVCIWHLVEEERTANIIPGRMVRVTCQNTRGASSPRVNGVGAARVSAAQTLSVRGNPATMFEEISRFESCSQVLDRLRF